jgi:hypothetical protein
MILLDDACPKHGDNKPIPGVDIPKDVIDLSTYRSLHTYFSLF